MPAPTNSTAKPRPSLHYRLVLTGQLFDGFERSAVAERLGKLLKIGSAKAATLLMGEATVIKRNLPSERAQSYAEKFKQLGVVALLEQEPISAASPTAATINTQEARPAKNNSVVNPSRSPKAIATRAQRSLIASAKLVPAATGICAIVAGYALVWFLLIGFAIAALVAIFISDISSTGQALYAVASLLALGIALLLMRPLFPRRSSRRESVTLEFEKHPKLAKFIQRVATDLGATIPVALQVDCGNSISIKQQRSAKILSVKLGAALLCTISTRELAALLASALGPWCSTRRTLLLYVNHASERLLAVASNNDGWQHWAARKSDRFYSPVISKLKTTLLRYSSLLFQPIQGLNHLLLKALQNDSQKSWDEGAIELVGTTAFIAALKREHVTQLASEHANQLLHGVMAKQYQVNNLPRFILYLTDTASQSRALQEKLGKDLQASDSISNVSLQARLNNRIHHAEDLDIQKQTYETHAAAELVANFNALCERVTPLFYREHGLNIKHQDLSDINQLLVKVEQERKREQQLNHYYNQWFKPDIFWPIPKAGSIEAKEVEAGLSEDKLAESQRQQLNDIILRIRHLTPDYLSLLEHEKSAREKHEKFFAANEIRKAGYAISSLEAGIAESQLASFQIHADEARLQYTGVAIRIHKMREHMGLRLYLAASLHPDAIKKKQAFQLLDTLARLRSHFDKIYEMRFRVGLLPQLDKRLHEKKETEHSKKIARVCRDIPENSDAILRALNLIAFPYVPGFNTLANFVQSHLEPVPPKGQLSVAQAVKHFSEIQHGLNSANHILNSQLVSLTSESERLNNIVQIKIALT